MRIVLFECRNSSCKTRNKADSNIFWLFNYRFYKNWQDLWSKPLCPKCLDNKRVFEVKVELQLMMNDNAEDIKTALRIMTDSSEDELVKLVNFAEILGELQQLTAIALEAFNKTYRK